MVAENAPYKYLLYQKSNHAAWITLNRPEARNAQSPAMREEIIQAVSQARDDDDAYVIVITGAGDAFCAGGDIVGFPQNPVEFMDRIGLQTKGKKRPVDVVRETPKPVIAMVNGLALGAGCELAIACDLIIASSDAKFAQPEIKVGLIPGGGGTQVLPRIVGEKKAKEMVLTGDMISAEDAAKFGLVNKVVPRADLKKATDELVANLTKKSPIVLKFAKMALNKALEMPLSAGLAYESDLCALCFGTEDLKEGAKAFAEKRPPVYKGK